MMIVFSCPQSTDMVSMILRKVRWSGEVSGPTVTFDVTAWPAGTYLLRITTPMGTVTKKLLVR